MSRNRRANIDRAQYQQYDDRHDRWREDGDHFNRHRGIDNGHISSRALPPLYPREYHNEGPHFSGEEPLRNFIPEQHQDIRSLADGRVESVFTRLDQQGNSSHHVMERLGPSSADLLFNKPFSINAPPGGGHPMSLFHSPQVGSGQNSSDMPRPQHNLRHSFFSPPPSQSLPPPSLSPPSIDLVYNNNNNYPNHFNNDRYIDPAQRQSSSVHYNDQSFENSFNSHGYDRHQHHLNLSDRNGNAPIMAPLPDRRPLFTPPVVDRRPLFTPPIDRPHTPTQSLSPHVQPLIDNHFPGRRPRSPSHLSLLAQTSNEWSPSRSRRSLSPRRESLSPQRRSPRRYFSPQRSPGRSLSPQRRSPRRYLSSRRSPRRSLSPQRRSPGRYLSPRRHSPRTFSPQRSLSPRRSLSPQRPSQRSFSPRRSRRSLSPQRRPQQRLSPRRRSPRRSSSPQRSSPRRSRRLSPERSPRRSLSPLRKSRSSPMGSSPPLSPLGRLPSSPVRVSPPLRHHSLSNSYSHTSSGRHYRPLIKKESPVRSYQSPRAGSSDRMPATRPLKMLPRSSPIPFQSKHKSSPRHSSNTSITPQEDNITKHSNISPVKFENQHSKSQGSNDSISAFVFTVRNKNNPSIAGSPTPTMKTATHRPHEVSTEDQPLVKEASDDNNIPRDYSMENKQRLESVTQWIQSTVTSRLTYTANDDTTETTSDCYKKDLQNIGGMDVQYRGSGVLESGFEDQESVCSTPELRIDCSANVESMSGEYENYTTETANMAATEEEEGVIVPPSTQGKGTVSKKINNHSENMEQRIDVENGSFKVTPQGRMEGKGTVSERADCEAICNDVSNKIGLDEREENRQGSGVVLNKQLMANTLLEYVEYPNMEVNKCSGKGKSISKSNSNKERPESPESGEIIDSDEEKEEGEIEEPLEAKESLDKVDHNRRKPSSNDSAKSRDGVHFFKRQYQSCISPNKYNNRSRDNMPDRRSHNSERRHYYKSMQYHQSDERWKRRRRSSPPLPPAVVVDDEKELLLLRTAALETMIIRPKQSPEHGSSTELKVSQEDKIDEQPDKQPDEQLDKQQELVTAIEDKGCQEVVDMNLVTSDSSSTTSIMSLSRDNTPEVTNVPPSQPLATTDTSNRPLKAAGTNSASVKVVTNKNATWKIQNFSIITSDTEDEDNDGGDSLNDVNDVVQLYRQVAEAKVSGTGRSLSSLNVELKECEDEMEEEEMKMELLEQQIQVSRHKITKLKEQKREVEMKIAVVSNLTNPLKVPTISVVAPPTGAYSPYSNTPSPTPILSKLDPTGNDVIPTGSISRVSSVSSVATANEDQSTPVNLSRPPSLHNSPSPSSSCDQRSGSNIIIKVSASPSTAEVTSSIESSTTITTSVPSSSSATGKSTKQKQLINLVTARQNNLAQVKGLLEMIENNQRKRKKSPNMVQPISKKIHLAKRKHEGAAVTPAVKNMKRHKKNSTGSTDTVTITTKPKVSSQLTKSSQQASRHSKTSLVTKNTPSNTSQPSSSSSTRSEEPKTTDLESILKQLNIECLEEAKLKKWFDHMTSSDVSSGNNMPRPLCPLTPVCMAVNHFPREETTCCNQEMATSSLRKILLKPSKLSPVIKGCAPSLLPYESPLLKFRSYRLCPLYRTLFKNPLSSLTHSNTIRPNVIMCHHESQGQCKDKACKAQHFANVAMTHDDIISDLTRYLPPHKEASVREKLSKFSKLETDQLQTMAAHLISQELSHDDHMTISNRWLENKSETLLAVPPPTKPNLLPSLEPINAMLDSFPTIQSTLDSGCTRYFQTDADEETTPTSLIKRARDSDSDDNAYAIIEDGLESFPGNELLWLECFRIAQKLKKLSNELFNRAVSSAPFYRIYYEIIKLSVDKVKWILLALKHFINIEERSDTVSHTILELVLSYCTWYIVMFSNGMEIALDFLLNFTEDIPESLVLQRLSRDDKVFLGLVHLQLLYTGKLPVTVSGCHGNPVPVRITSNKHYLIPFTCTRKISQDLFDDMMNLFHRYLKKMADPTYNVSINIANCLPLYINLFYFEMSQGNSRTTAISVSRLLTTVPNIRELLVMKSVLEPSLAPFIEEEGGIVDPLVYYILARRSLLQDGSSDTAVSLLTKCVHGYFAISDQEENQFDTFMLYRKLLGYQIPYDVELPSLRTTDLDRSSLCLNYCLLVELTTPTLCNEVYEVSLHYNDLVWLQFVSFLSHQFKTTPTLKNAKQLLDVCQRFSLAIPLSSPYLCQIQGAESHYSDHTLHNQMLDMLLGCVDSMEDKALLLKHIPMYFNPYWVYRFYQFSECLEQVRVVLAQYLTKFPYHVDIWLMGISIEMRLGNFRQARWMLTKAVHFVPYSSKLWTQFVMFELTGIVKHYSSPLLLQTIVNKINLYGIEINHPF